MNREIKFRGKRISDGEWVYGDLLNIAGGCIIYHGSQTECQLIEDRPNLAIELHMDEVSPVFPDTVGQYTGLYDAEGREIYEGDIIESSFGGGIPARHFIGYEQKEASFTANLIGTYPNSGGIRQQWIDSYGKKVIGNIYENKELLEETK